MLTPWLQYNTSALARSEPGPGWTPSHQPWYAPANCTINVRPVLKRQSRTAHMTASVPDMWKLTSSLLAIFFKAGSTSEMIGWTGPSTFGPRSLTRAHARSTKPL